MARALTRCVPLALACLPALSPVGLAARGETSLQAVIDELRARLSIPEDVRVAVVDQHSLLVSVERSTDRPDTFLLKFEGRFLEQLGDDEIRAAVAHELGHVWIFTHHPYLHTEALANRIAMRVVSRAALAEVYRRMWARQGIEGDLVSLIGAPSPASPPPTPNGDEPTLDLPATVEPVPDRHATGETVQVSDVAR